MNPNTLLLSSIRSIDWGEAANASRRALYGFSAISILSVLPIFGAVLIVSFSPPLPDIAESVVNGVLLCLVILTLSHAMGVAAGVFIRFFEQLRKAMKHLWLEYTPPYPEYTEVDVRGVPLDDRGNFKQCERKSYVYYSIAVLVLGVELGIILISVGILEILQVKEIAELPVIISAVIDIVGWFVGLLPFLDVIHRLFPFVSDMDDILIGLSIPPAIAFVFASQNAAYIFSDIDFLRKMRNERELDRYELFVYWVRVSVATFGFIVFFLITRSGRISLGIVVLIWGLILLYRRYLS